MKQEPLPFTPTDEHICPFRIYYIALLLTAALVLSACGSKAQPSENLSQMPMREARPTFTPTIGAPPPLDPVGEQQPTSDQQPTPQQSEPGATQAPPPQEAAAVSSKAMMTIKEELVNTRTGPGLNYDLVEMVERGQSFEITGKTVDGGWWQICCVKSQQVWVINNSDFVDNSGDLGSVAVINDLPGVGGGAPAVVATPIPQPVAANPTPAPQPTATNAPPPPAAPAFGFDLVAQEQFPDTNVVHIFLFVFEGSNALSGYSLRVSHNGTELSTAGQTSIGPQPGLTWPIPDGRQRLQNLKLEFAGEQPGGTWEAQLMSNGQAAGPVATFKLSDNEPNRELYVRYQKK